MRSTLLAWCFLALPSCSSIPEDALPAPAYPRLEPNWKERLTQPYVFLEHRGDYRELGDAMRRLLAEADALELEGSDVPFALFFDDPGRTPTSELRSRACLPVESRPEGPVTLQYDVLPRAMVVYARVGGAYPDVARSYPALFSYLDDLGWRQGGPVREIYLVNPADVADYGELVTEVQIPGMAK